MQGIENFNINFPRNKFITISGSNNCGKTTLIKILSGILQSHGEITLSEVNLNKKNIYRFKESKELGHIEKYFFNYPFKIYKDDCKDIR